MTLLPPSTEMLKIINCELSPNPEQTSRDVTQLRAWLDKQPHLPGHMDDTILERFLYGCKFSVERTKALLERYYTVRATVPELFDERDPMSRPLQDCFKDVNYLLLPGFTAEGYRVTILSFNSSDVSRFDLPTLAKRIVMTLDARLLMENNLNNVMVIDLHNFTVTHAMQCLPTNPVARKGMLCIQDAFPLRLARLHFLNTPPAIHKLVTLFAPLLKEKLMYKFVFHTGGGEALQQYMPKEILPLEYGGNAGTIQELNASWQRRVESLQQWYKEEERVSKADETKRVREKHSYRNELLTGTIGSFRQLSID